jgi:hypothetical protein
MQLSISAGWVYSVAQVVRSERTSQAKWKERANQDAGGEVDRVNFNLQTLTSASCFSQNAVKMAVNAGILIPPGVDWVLRVCRNLSAALHRYRYAR